MFRKLTAIAWKDIYLAFRDRNAMLMMFAMPIALSVIIGLAFGTGGDISIDAVPVGVVNHDAGADVPGGENVSFGALFERAFVPQDNPSPDEDFAQIHALTAGVAYDDADAARRRVEDGALAAAIVVPDADFTARALSGSGPVTVDVLYDSGRSVGPSVVSSIMNALTNGMNSVIIAQRVGPQALQQIGQDLGADQAAIAQAVAQLSTDALQVAQDAPIRLEQLNLQGETRTFDALQYFAPSMAILFMTFAMASGATSILNESRQWTLQRIITTPTPRWVFMGGKLAGTYGTGVAQMAILVLSTSLIALLMGRDTPVWGTNYAGIALLVLAVVFAATSLGLLIAALVRTPEQASTYSTVVLFVLGMLGGSFMPVEALPDVISWLPRLTLNYWGIQGFFDLAYNEAALSDIAPNLLALVAMGAVLFLISLWRFSRRLDLGR